MPYYPKLRHYISDRTWEVNPMLKEYTDRQKKLNFVIDRILSLKDELKKVIPQKTITETFLLATWNIREFDSNGKKQGPRLEECFYYIAEIIASFDLVAIQEVKNDLGPLKKLKGILGPQWDFIVTDKTEGRSGNDERIAFMYDTSKVRFGNIAGEVVLPDKGTKSAKQFARSPFLVTFQSGWLRINLCSVHIYFGSDSNKTRRIKEIEDLSVFLGNRAKKDFENYILLGDFNITSKEDKTMKALLKGGFKVPPQLQKLAVGSNLAQNKFYDQIAYANTYNSIQFTGKAGVFNYYKQVFTDEELDLYLDDYNMLMKANGKPEIAKMTPKIYKEWKTFQMSDHLPLWCEYKIDFSEEYLKRLKK
jgi:exonuclease III